MTQLPIRFLVPGEPVPKARPRAVRIGHAVRIFTPDDTADYERTVRVHALRAVRAAGWPPLAPEDRFAVEIELLLGTRRHKDLDNCAKSILDGMMPVALLDDWQVTSLLVTRLLRAPEPGARVSLRRVEELEALDPPRVAEGGRR